MKIRLEEVAAEAGVSKATASRVLNGKPGVSEQTRHQVMAALELLGYARRAKAGRPRNGLIGLIIPELDNTVFPLFATDPPLTTVRQNPSAISVHAVNALLDEIRGTPQPHREILIHPELIVRGSTGSAPVRLRAATSSVPGR